MLSQSIKVSSRNALHSLQWKRLASSTKIPKSLLKKQEQRLAQSNLTEKELKQLETQKLKNQANNLLLTSLKDISGYFNPGGATSNEDDLEKEHVNGVKMKSENDFIDRLMMKKFNIDLNSLESSASKVDERLWCSSFDSIEYQDLEVLDYYLDISLLERYGHKWDNIPKPLQQLLYYRSYGSYGPRGDLEKTFVCDTQRKPQDFLWLRPSPSVFSLKNDVHLLKPKELKLVSNLAKTDLSQISNGLINVYECSDKRNEHWKSSFNKVDTGSKIVLYIMATVSLLCAYQDKNYIASLGDIE